MSTDAARLVAYRAVFATLAAYERDAYTCATVWRCVHAALRAYTGATRPYTYLWWRPGASRVGPLFPPVEPDHAYHGAVCVHPLCGAALGDGSLLTLLVVGPDNDDAAAAHADGRPYSALAVPVHARCVGSEPR